MNLILLECVLKKRVLLSWLTVWEAEQNTLVYIVNLCTSNLLVYFNFNVIEYIPLLFIVYLHSLGLPLNLSSLLNLYICTLNNFLYLYWRWYAYASLYLILTSLIFLCLSLPSFSYFHHLTFTLPGLTLPCKIQVT